VDYFVTMRIRLLNVSAMNRLPAASSAMPQGRCSEAAVGSPPSPPKPALPLPATVAMLPVAGSTTRIRWLSVSAMNSRPSPSIAMSRGHASDASVAGPPSPEKPAAPLPGDGLDGVRGEVDATDALVLGVGDVQAVLCVERQRAARLGVVARHLEHEQRAAGGPPSPAKPGHARRRRRSSMTPSLPMRRTRKLRVSAT
jgi:hypothetical protein